MLRSILFLLPLLVSTTLSHLGHHHGDTPWSTEKGGGPITLTERERENIGLKMQVVKSRNIWVTSKAWGLILHATGNSKGEESEWIARIFPSIKGEMRVVGEVLLSCCGVLKLLPATILDVQQGKNEDESLVRLHLKNSDGRLREGISFKIQYGLRTADEVLAVPRQAILGSPGNLFVLVEDERSFYPTPVETGVENEDWVEVVSGIFPGDRIVVQGQYVLQFAESRKPTDKK